MGRKKRGDDGGSPGSSVERHNASVENHNAGVEKYNASAGADNISRGNRGGRGAGDGGDWQNFSVGGSRAGGFRTSGRDAGWSSADPRQDGSAGARGMRDNNLSRGRDRYGSRQYAAQAEKEKINAGFRNSGETKYYTDYTLYKTGASGFPGGGPGYDQNAGPTGGQGAGPGGRAGGQRFAGVPFLFRAADKLNINSFSVPAYFVKLILAIALSFSVIYAVVKTSGLAVAPATVFLACAAFALFYSLLFHKAYVANATILAIAAAAGIYVFHMYRTERLDDLRVSATFYFRLFTYWTAGFFYTGQPHNELFEFILFMILSAVLCLAVYFVTIKKYVYACMFAIGFATFCVQWCFGFYAGYPTFFVFISVAVVGYVWHIYLKHRGLFGDLSALFTPARFLKSLAPLILCMLFAIIVIPAPNSPIRWQWLYDIFNDVTNVFYDRYYYHRVDSFALNTTGFSNGESFLSGPVRLNNTLVLTVKSDNPALYLKGNGKEIYTGNSWRNNIRMSSPNRTANNISGVANNINSTANNISGTVNNIDGTENDVGGVENDNAKTVNKIAGFFRANSATDLPNAVIRFVESDAAPEPGDAGAGRDSGATGGSGVTGGSGATGGSAAGPSSWDAEGENAAGNNAAGENAAGEGASGDYPKYDAYLVQSAWGIKIPDAGAREISGAPASVYGGPPEAGPPSLIDESRVADREAALASAEEEAILAESKIAEGLAEPRAVARARTGDGKNAADGGKNAAAGGKNAAAGLFLPAGIDADEFGSLDMTDVRAMEKALKLMDSGAAYRIPGPRYYGRDTEVDRDVDEYMLNHMLYQYRLMAGGSSPVLTRIGVTPEMIRRSSQWMLGQDLVQASVLYERMKTYSLFTSSKMTWITDFNQDAGEIYEDGGALTMERIMTEGFNYTFGYYPEERQAEIAQRLLYNSYPGLYRDLLGDFGDTVIISYRDNALSRNSGANSGSNTGANSGAGSGANAGSDRNRRPAADSGGGAGGRSADPEEAFDLRRRELADIGIYVHQAGDYIEREELEILAERADEIALRYTALPETLPERVWILAEQLTEGARTPYEKALLLEHFLYTNYSYSLNAGYLAPGEDFVDNFLFTQTDGYCTHFASALAVMARCVGLPSRYVEGYTMPAELDEYGVYRVTNAESHAWVEIYFEGYGWRRFEPTATYQERFKTANYYGGAGYTGGSGGGGYGGDYYDYMEEMMRESRYFNYPGAFVSGTPAAGSKLSRELIFSAIRAALIALAFLIPASIVAAGRSRASRRFLSFRGEPSRAVRSMYAHYMKILDRLKYNIRSGETLSQFASRADGALKTGKNGLASAVGVFEKLIYSNHEITESDRQQVQAVYPQLLTAYSIRTNKVKFFIMKDVIADI